MIAKQENQRAFSKIFVAVVAVTLSTFQVYTAMFGSLEALKQRSIHLILALSLVFLLFPTIKNIKRNKIGIENIVLLILNFVSIGWILYDFERIRLRVPLTSSISNMELVLGVILIILILEATRRTIGWPLPFLALLSLLYLYYGPQMPGVLMHRGMPFYRIVELMYLTREGIFGIPIGVTSTFVFLFILFGTFLKISGSGNFFIELAYALTGRSPGGPAKTAIIGSALMGTMSGSVIGNVVTTGTFTIPLMKKSGYPAYYAAAVEVAASAGGQLMPPIMGVGVFMMAEFTGVPYFEIIKVAFIPALLYFFSVYVSVHLQAKKLGLQGAKDFASVPFMKIIKQGYLHFLPLIVLLYNLIAGYSIMRSGVRAIICCFIIFTYITIKKELKNKNYKIILKKLFFGFLGVMEEGAKTALPVISACACAGIVLGVVSFSGIGLKFSSILISASGGNLFFLIILVGLASLVLGMGLPTSSAYIVCAIIAAPALREFGIPLLTAHLMVFWLSQTTHTTPPVCIATYTAASIAKAPPMKTALAALNLAKGLYIFPFLMAYRSILLDGSLFDVLGTIIAAILAIIVFAMSLEGYGYRKIALPERVLFFICGLMFLYTNIYINILGMIIFTILLIRQKTVKKDYAFSG